MPTIVRRFPFSPPPPPPSSVQSTTAMPPLPFLAETRHGVPFMVYHVCSVCKRPRSARFHRENPVEEGQRLPRSTACHRCIEQAPLTLLPPPPPAPATTKTPSTSTYSIVQEEMKHSHTCAFSRSEGPAVARVGHHEKAVNTQRLEAERLLKAHPHAFSHGIVEPVVRKEERRTPTYAARPAPLDPQPSVTGYTEVRTTYTLPFDEAPSRPRPHPVEREHYYATHQYSHPPAAPKVETSLPHRHPPRQAPRQSSATPLHPSPVFYQEEDQESLLFDTAPPRSETVQTERYYGPPPHQAPRPLERRQSHPPPRQPSRPLERKQYYPPAPRSSLLMERERFGPPHAESSRPLEREQFYHPPPKSTRPIEREQFCPPHPESSRPLEREQDYPYPPPPSQSSTTTDSSEVESYVQPRYIPRPEPPTRPEHPVDIRKERRSARPSQAPSTANTRKSKPNVSFASHDHVAVLPPDLPSELGSDVTGGMSRLRGRGRDLDGSVPETFDDFRGRRVADYVEEANKHYEPEPNRALARALSESPSRERLLSLKQGGDASYSHGPYRAEVSPTGSMEVWDDSDAASRDRLLDVHDEDDWKDLRRKRNEDVYEPEAPPSPKEFEDGEEPTWTKYVKVREYRDEKGPYVEVEETIVYDED